MADGYLNRQPQVLPPGFAKRPRIEYEMPPSGLETRSYLTRDDDRGGSRMVKDTRAIGSAYDRYLQNQLSSSSARDSAYSGPALGKSPVGGISGHLIADHSLLSRYGVISDPTLKVRGSNLDIQHPAETANKPARGALPLPLDASNTIYVECLPSDCTKREVARILNIYPRLCGCRFYYSFRWLLHLCVLQSSLDIFRPFVGYKEVRLVTKDSRHVSSLLVAAKN
ncbi:hypothetical protein QQ045_013310 [Rhodiola kirilowii]